MNIDKIRAGAKVVNHTNPKPRYGIILLDGLQNGRVLVDEYTNLSFKTLLTVGRFFVCGDTEELLPNTQVRYEKQKQDGLPEFFVTKDKTDSVFSVENSPEAYNVFLKYCLKTDFDGVSIHTPPAERERSIRTLMELRPELSEEEAGLYVRDGRSEDDGDKEMHGVKFNLHLLPNSPELAGLDEQLQVNFNHRTYNKTAPNLCYVHVDKQEFIKQLVRDGVRLSKGGL